MISKTFFFRGTDCSLLGNPLRLGEFVFWRLRLRCPLVAVLEAAQFFSLMFNSCHVWCSLRSTLPNRGRCHELYGHVKPIRTVVLLDGMQSEDEMGGEE